MKSELIRYYTVEINQLNKDIHRMTAKRDYYEDEIKKLNS